MTEDRKDTTHDLLNIVDRLVDNMQDANTTNAEVLKSVNVSITKVSEYIPEIRSISTKINELDTEKIEQEVRSISTSLKIMSAVLSIVITLGLVILGLYQAKTEDEIVKQVTIKIEQSFDNHAKMEQNMKILEDAKRK